MRTRKSFQFRLAVSFIGIIFLALLLMGVFSFPALKRVYISHLEENLRQEALLIGEVVREKLPDEKAIQNLALLAARDTGARVTIVDQQGSVLGDSEKDPRQMENHGQRPEIKEALAGKTGVAQRFSSTLGYQMLYVAVPVESSGEVKAVVRMSLPLNEVAKLQWYLALILLISFLMAGGAGIFAGIVLARRLTAPLCEMTEVVEDMASGNLERRVYYHEDDVIGKLAKSFNRMADTLAAKMRQISDVTNRLKTVLNTTGNGFLLINGAGKVEYANPAFVRIFRIPPDTSLLGRNYLEVAGCYELARIVEAVISSKKPQSREITLYGRGEQVLAVQGVPVLDEGDFLKGVLLVVNDITQLKRLEQVRKDFVADVSHELKTPITVIRGFAETILEEPENTEAVTEFSRIIYNEAGRMEKIIKNLLDLSKLETGNVQLKREPLSLRSIAEEAGRFLKQKHDFFLELQGDGVAMVDYDLFLQVFLNLFDNAIKYSRPPARIEVSFEENKSKVFVKVKDEGIGIPERELPRVFERFYRVDKARSRKTGGTGLGLAIVKHIIELHGGEVGVQSRLGQGSVFYFTVPTMLPCGQNG
ncbi:MAG TPA: hypothetical protein DCE07_01875 [Peptococcaceae bacterium]|nr:hypothetical protein [Peptococcaceae bacterium]